MEVSLSLRSVSMDSKGIANPYMDINSRTPHPVDV
jgi:hypothetical protein